MQTDHHIRHPDIHGCTYWNDLETGKNYLLHNETGQATQVTPEGEFIKEYDSTITGRFNYTDRIAQSHGKRALLPYPVPPSTYHAAGTYYNPQNDKFEGYAQFPNPRTQPYFNQEDEYRLNRKKRIFIQTCQETLKFAAPQNTSLYTYQGTRRHNLGTTFLTGTLRDLSQATLTHKINVLKERNPQHQDAPYKGGETQGVKIVNERTLQEPSVKPASTKSFLATAKSRSMINLDQNFGKIPFSKGNTGGASSNATGGGGGGSGLGRSSSVANATLGATGSQQDAHHAISHQIHVRRFDDKVRALSHKTLSFASAVSDVQRQVIETFNTKDFPMPSRTGTRQSSRPRSQQKPSSSQSQRQRVTRKSPQKATLIEVANKKENLITQGRKEQQKHFALQQEHLKDRRRYLSYGDDYLLRMEAKKIEKLDQEKNRRNLIRKVIEEQIVQNEKQEAEKCKTAWGLK